MGNQVKIWQGLQERHYRPDIVRRPCADQAGMPLYFTPCRTIQNSASPRMDDDP